MITIGITSTMNDDPAFAKTPSRHDAKTVAKLQNDQQATGAASKNRREIDSGPSGFQNLALTRKRKAIQVGKDNIAERTEEERRTEERKRSPRG